MRILAICPSNRPDDLKKMIDSYTVTSSKNIRIIVNYENKSITQIFNETFEKNPDEDFYHLMNDDCIYKTPLWDTILAKKHHIGYGDDCFQHQNLCTFPMIDGDIVRALGWIQMPELDKYFGDNIWHTIGMNLGILEYHPEVIIEHHWDGKLDQDKFTSDQKAYINWAYNDLSKDLEKIRKVLNG